MLLDDVALYLQSAGLGVATTSGTTTIFRGRLPDSPDTVIVVYEYGGLQAEQTLRPGPGAAILEWPRVQCVARGAPFDYASPRTTIEAVKEALDAVGGSPLTSTGPRYALISALQAPFPLARDANERVTHVVNFQVAKERST